MKKVQQGFTLIELMIVVAIIGILAAVAIPAYQDYTQRAQVAEAFTMTAGAKTAIAEYAQSNGAYPDTAALQDLDLDGTAISGNYADATVAADSGVITIQMKAAGVVGANIANGNIVLTPPDLTTMAGAFTWDCTTAASEIEQKFLPKSCSAS
jgi:type IV pilus assembly protein PilA